MKSEKKLLRNWFTYQQEKGEFVDTVSETTPDMAYTIPEIMHRFSSGRGISGNGLDYSGDMPDLRNVDIEERREIDRANRERISRLRKEIDDKDKARKEALKKHNDKIQSLLDAQELDDMTNNSNVKEPKNKRSDKKGDARLE